jgi:hypothetical protein
MPRPNLGSITIDRTNRTGQRSAFAQQPTAPAWPPFQNPGDTSGSWKLVQDPTGTGRATPNFYEVQNRFFTDFRGNGGLIALRSG